MSAPVPPNHSTKGNWWGDRTVGRALRLAQMCVFRWRGRTRYRQTFYSSSLREALGKSTSPSHISDHLSSLFFFTLDARPRLIVELGTGGGESTRVFLAAASIAGAIVLSIDKKDCSHLELPFKERWHFERADDVEFGKTRFVEWCRRHSIEPEIDVLFIDTSHKYEHTKQEIETWSSYLSDHATLLCHDTNMGTGPYGRLDGSVGFGYDNQRGVIRVLEELAGRRYNESTVFADFAGGYLILHHPNCSGLAILKKGCSQRSQPADRNATGEKPPGATLHNSAKAMP